MNKAQAIQNFFESFGLTAYPASSVPDNAAFPYLTYENAVTANGRTAYPTVNLWYKTTSEAVLNAKVEQITTAIGQGVSVPCDNGAIYVYFNDTWNSLADVEDATIKRRFTNLTMTFNTF